MWPSFSWISISFDKSWFIVYVYFNSMSQPAVKIEEVCHSHMMCSIFLGHFISSVLFGE